MTDDKQTGLSLDDHELLLRLAKQQRTAVIQRHITVFVEILILILILVVLKLP